VILKRPNRVYPVPYNEAIQLKETKKRAFLVVLLLPLFFVLVMMPWPIKAAADETECVRCHTNLKKLMDLSWEVKKHKPKTEVSKKTSGEG
jgi:hypothetical protein